MNILIMGPAGAGKGTMSDLILKEYDIPHISTGDMLRENVRNNTELGKMAKSYMEAGKLVPDDVINAMVEDDAVAEKGKDLSVRAVRTERRAELRQRTIRAKRTA